MSSSGSRVALRNIDIIDGGGGARYRGDIEIVDDRISAILTGPRRASGSTVIDGTGLVAAPGFIDMHAHSDLTVLSDPEHLGKLSQGCTVEVVGQDGLSYAPLTDQSAAQLWDALAAWNGQPDAVDLNWRGVGDYLDLIDRGSPTNVAYLIPHGTLRMQAVGWENRQATQPELNQMRSAVTDGMSEGAMGLSAGLTYAPGLYADASELIQLCRIVAGHGGFFAPHQRSYGHGALEGYREMFDIGLASGCPVHLTHATMNFSVNRGRAPELVDLIDSHLAHGNDITLDSYPFLAGMTSLSALLPSWAMESGLAGLDQKLQSADFRNRIQYELDEVGTDGAHGVPVEWHGIEVAGVHSSQLQHLVGLSIADAAQATDSTPAEFYLNLLQADEYRSTCLMHVGHEPNVRHLMRHPTHMGGSDGLLHGSSIHPRAWGTFPRYLGHYVRDVEVFSLEECVAHLTSRPARRLSLADRGHLAVGAIADIVLFDPAVVRERATYAYPRRTAVGIPYVFVNGNLAIADGYRTDALAGRSLRRRARPRYRRRSPVHQ